MSFLSVPVSLSTFFPNNRLIEDIEVDVILSESTNDTLTITKQPVQQGATITDHAYMEPTTLTMSVYFRDNLTTDLSDIYEDLLFLQTSREPITVTTPKRKYESMLIASISMTTDKNTENILAVNISFQEVIIVKVSTVQVTRAAQKNPGATGKTELAGKKSFLKQGTDAAAGLFKGALPLP